MSNLNPGGLTRVLNYIKTWVTGLLNGKANSSHTHTKSQITDFPTIPSKTSQLTNDSGFLTAHQSLSNYSTLANTVKSLSISGKTITVTPGSGSAYTLTTQDTVYTHPTTAGNKHIPSGGSANQYLKYSASGTAVWANLPTIPSKTSQLTNDSGYITSTGSCSYSTTSGTSTYSTYLKSLGAQTPKSGRDIFHSGVYTYTTFTDTNTPAHYGAVIGYGNGQGGSCEMFAEWVGSGQLWFRVLRDYQDSWTNWQQIITSNNIGSQSVNYANSAGSVAWSNVTGKPTIPTNTNQLTNGAGFITSSGSCNYANSAGSAPANGGTSTATAYMNQHSTITYGVNRLQYYNTSTSTTSGATNIANPYDDWFYHLLMSHANVGGWYGDLAMCFHSDTLAFRRIVNGSDQGWCYLVKNGRIIVSGYELYID